MREWFTAHELAGLPGLPGTHSAVVRRAKRDGWVSRRRKGRGGGREYGLASLPAETQAALLRREGGQKPAAKRPARQPGVADRETLWQVFESKPQTLKDTAAYRVRALRAVQRLTENGVGRSRAVAETADAFGESRATLYRWLKAVKGLDEADWLPALAPAYQGRADRAECSPEAWDFFKSQYLRQEGPAIATCYEWMREAAAENGWSIPSLRTINRWVSEIPLTVRVLKREGEEALMRLYPSLERTVAELHALEWINGDGYQHNVFVEWPDGTVGRPKTWFWHDVYSRKFLAWRTDRTEHSDMIRLAIGDVLEHYGIPEHVTIDNTRAAANKWLSGGLATRYRFKVVEDEPLGLFPQLDIKVHWTSVHNGKGHGQGKPVERAFGVGGLGEYVDKHPKLAGAYTGPNPQEKPENYGSRAVPFETFVEVLSGAIKAWNERPGRRTEICGGRLSFDQAFRESYERNAHLIRRPTEAQRRLWLLTAEATLVHKDGTVRLTVGSGPNGRNRYGSDALIDYIGRKVVVRFDPATLHEGVHCYQLDGRYIGRAECLEAAGFGDTNAAREWARQRKRRMAAAKEAAAAELRMSAVEAADYLPDPEPESPQPQTNVVRGAWREKRAAGSDITPDQEEAEYHRNFEELMRRAGERWQENVLPIGGSDDEA